MAFFALWTDVRQRPLWVQYYDIDTDWRIAGMATKTHCEYLCQWAGLVTKHVPGLSHESLKPQHEVASQPPPPVAAVQVTHTTEPPPRAQQQQPPPKDQALPQEQDLSRQAELVAQQLIEVTLTTEPPPTAQQPQPPPPEQALPQQQDLAHEAPLMAQQLIEVTAGLNTDLTHFYCVTGSVEPCVEQQ